MSPAHMSQHRSKNGCHISDPADRDPKGQVSQDLPVASTAKMVYIAMPGRMTVGASESLNV